MPFSAEQISYAGKAAMDYIVRKSPEDLYNTDRPLLKLLNSKKRSFPGAKQYIQEKLRTTNDSNFQWFGPDEEVSYNRKRTLSEANFAWGSAHDGFALTEEELLQNYITISDDRSTATNSEKHQFINLITENTETLKLGFSEKLDYELHLDGTQDPDAIPGLDLLISTTPTTGTVGGINRATTTLWRNYAETGISTATAGNLTARMEVAHRTITRIGGNAPDVILAGSKFIDAYRVDAQAGIQQQVVINQNGNTKLDAGIMATSFKGVPIIWDPVMDDLQAALNPTVNWDKRAYFINSRFLHLRPAQGQDMVVRRPPRVYNRYTHYWGLTWRGAMTITRPSAMAVLSIA